MSGIERVKRHTSQVDATNGVWRSYARDVTATMDARLSTPTETPSSEMTQRDVSSSAWPAKSVVDDSAFEALRDLSRTVRLLERDGRWSLSDETVGGERHAIAPPCRPEDLGDATFCHDVALEETDRARKISQGLGATG